MALIFPLLLLGIMYAFLILPQRKRQKAHAEVLRAVAPGDEILTSGGIYGGVTEIDGDDLYLEIAPDVEIKISRRAVAERLSPGVTLPATPAAAAPSEPETPELELDEPAVTDNESTQKGFKKK
jgi:preprotein translocase subunit YajC